MADFTFDIEPVKTYLMQLQDRICEGLEGADGKGLFSEESWQRPGGGGGRSNSQ